MTGDEALDDIAVTAKIGSALVVGFTGLGVKQKGEGRFLHLDDLGTGEHTVPRPALWSY